MNFASDNWAGATEAVMAAVIRHNGGFAPAYGDDPLTHSVIETFQRVFEADVEVFFVPSGTAANALSLSAAARPGGLVFCSRDAHLLNGECGATEFFTSMKLSLLPTADGLISADGLAAALARFPAGSHAGMPTVVSLTQASECGTVYPVDEIAAIAALAHEHGMIVHMDGARFANAVAALGATPAEITWRAGVDILSFGGTKNGCWAAEAVVIMPGSKFPDFPVLRQRAGHTLSKSRFIAAQYEAYFAGGAWLRTAAHANAMATRLREGISARGLRLGWNSIANEVFPVLPASAIERLQAAGASFHPWASEAAAIVPGEQLVRLVTSFATTEAEVDRFLSLL